MPRSGRSLAGCPVNAVMLILIIMLTAAVLSALPTACAPAAAVTGELPSITGQADDIATVVSVSPDKSQLEILRRFRDDVLLTNPAGAFLWTTYTAVSPPIAAVLLEHEHLSTATRILLLTPVIYLAALCLNMIALLAFFVLILLALVILRRHLQIFLKGVLYGFLVSFAFIIAAVMLGALGHELPACAVIAAYLLPVIIPIGLAVCLITWSESRARPRAVPRLRPRLY